MRSMAGALMAVMLALAGAESATAGGRYDAFREVGEIWAMWHGNGGRLEVDFGRSRHHFRGAPTPGTMFAGCQMNGFELVETAGGNYEGSYNWHDNGQGCKPIGNGEATASVSGSNGRYTMTFCSTPPPGTTVAGEQCATFASSSRRDSDEDGLTDEYERGGKAEPHVFHWIDIRRMGARANRPDIFVEVDAVSGHRLEDAALRLVADAFKEHGISLHIDNGRDSMMDAYSRRRWGNLSESNTLPHEDSRGRLLFQGATRIPHVFAEVDAIKLAAVPEYRDHFERAGTFRYAISAHQIIPRLDSSGLSRATLRQGGETDFVVAPAVLCRQQQRIDCNGTLRQQAATFMHELGHVLGLGHGGLDELHGKPNHLSLMNYLYSATGLVGRARTVFDYSSWGSRDVLDLNEAELHEQRGVRTRRGSPAASLKTGWWCHANIRFEPKTAWTNEPADFDCDGNPESRAVRTNLTPGSNSHDKLISFDEWSCLQYRAAQVPYGFRLHEGFGAAGGGSPVPFKRRGGRGCRPRLAAAAQEDSELEREPRASVLRRAARALLGDSKRPRLTYSLGKRKGGGGDNPLDVDVSAARRKLTLRARDNKAIDSIYVTVGGKARDVYARGFRKKRLRLTVRLPRGRGRVRVTAMALDQAGNSRSLRRTFRAR